MSNPREAFVTTLNTDNYLLGVLALDRSIRTHCRHSLYVLVSHGLAPQTYAALDRQGIAYGYAEDISVDPELFANLSSVFTHWANTLFKLRIFELEQFDKIVFIDSDMIVLESIDDLFDRPHMSAAVAGKSYPGNESWQELSSGVLVVEPCPALVEELIGAVPAVAAQKESFGDQDVINAYFGQWPQSPHLHLPESYNVFLDHYHYYHRNGGVKALHFIGRNKPWMLTRSQMLVQYIRCVVKGNASALGKLMGYRKSLREVGMRG